MEYMSRKATLKDALELARLRWESKAEHWDAQDWSAFARDFEAWMEQALSSGSWTAAVADIGNGQLVGCMFIESVSKVPVPGQVRRSWGYVTHSYVSPDHRGRRVGTRLLELIVSTARAENHEFLIVWPSREAVSLYTGSGFRSVAAIHDGADDYPPLELPLVRC